MNTYLVRWGAVLLLLLPVTVGAQSLGPLTVDDVADLARLQGMAAAKQALVRSSCVAFVLDDEATKQLRAAGADAALLAAVRTACFTGAELVVTSDPADGTIVVDGKRVATGSWTARYPGTPKVEVGARRGKISRYVTPPLREGRRTRVTFAFPLDTLPLPRVQSVADVSASLGLAQRWQPVEPEPQRPVLRKWGKLPRAMLLIGGVVAGAAYCSGETRDCGVERKLDEDGIDENVNARGFLGASVGFATGLVVNAIVGRTVNASYRMSYEQASARYRAWERSNDEARSRWIRTHPDVVARREAQERARAEAVRRNAEIRQRNDSITPTRITTERIAGGTP